MNETTAHYPQPHEGIAATDRTEDDLLATDDQAIARRLMMIGTVRALYSACLVGNPAPVVAEMWARMTDPRPGDLVMETGTPFRKSDPDAQIKGFGILIAHREEWASTDEEWAATRAEDPDVREDERFHDHAWYVQYGPSAEDVCRWTDCEFIAVPT